VLAQEIEVLNSRIRDESAFIDEIFHEIGKVIVGQRAMTERLLVALLADGHVLLEGVPGLAKTLTVSTLATLIDAKFRRLQFTPDLLPADLIGTLIFDPKSADFRPKKGPIFANIILADEINRAPAKVQSALLEAMQERQVTIGETTYPLDPPFLVMATQNPIEHEGTYPLPEAQVDRFMLKIVVDYPDRAGNPAPANWAASGEHAPAHHTGRSAPRPRYRAGRLCRRKSRAIRGGPRCGHP
jgi:MoxR-like ATPase